MDLPLTNLVVWTCNASHSITNTLMLFSCYDLSILYILLFSLSIQSIKALYRCNICGGVHHFVVLNFLSVLATLLLSYDLSHLNLPHSDVLSRFLNEEPNLLLRLRI